MRDPELTQLLHDDARIGTGDVAEDQVALGLARAPGRCTTVTTAEEAVSSSSAFRAS